MHRLSLSTNFGLKPLHVKVIKILLEGGADANVVGNDNLTTKGTHNSWIEKSPEGIENRNPVLDAIAELRFSSPLWIVQ